MQINTKNNSIFLVFFNEKQNQRHLVDTECKMIESTCFNLIR